MTNDPLIGSRLSNFVIEGLLGRGGMAQVYIGQDVKLQRPVAIKVIDARYRSKPVYAERFVKEARAVARWRHENIIQIYYADDQDGLYYYVMEYIDGPDLASVMASYSTRGEMMPVDEILRIGRSLASALDYAHKHGIIHRDVKPSNVFMSKGGRIVLGDFGLALDMQQGSSGEVFGTPHYISPEQVRRSTDAVPESDLYSLGVVLYEMLTGVVPFDDISPASVALQHITQPPPLPSRLNPQLNQETEAVLLKALSKSPADRYQSGASLMNALSRALGKSEITQRRVAPLPPPPAQVVSGKARPTTRKVQTPPKPSRKSRWPVYLFFFAALAIGGYFFRDVLFPGGLSLSTVTPTLASTQAPTATVPPVGVTPFVIPPPAATSTRAPALTVTSLVLGTFTPSPTLTLSPTSTPSPTPTFTPSPTATDTATLPPTSTPTQADLPTPTTTPEFVNLKRIWLYYDEYGFYLYNASDANRSISAFSFQRLDEDGEPLNEFIGWYWGEFYPNLHSGRCMRIEIQGNPSNYINPPVCHNIYLVTRSLTEDSEYIFWTKQAGSTQFVLLWQDEPVGTCEIGAGFCEIFIP